MTGPDDSQPATRDQALVAAVELEHRKHESAKRLRQLEEERSALEEIRDSLAAEEQALKARVGMHRQERMQKLERVEATTRRTVMIESEIEEVKREISILERRVAEVGQKDRVLSDELLGVEKQLDGAQAELTFASQALETGRATLSRIDHKLALRKLKR